MIKKVSSWVLGSFFRQVGRFLFFLILGGLVFLLIQHNNINFNWTDLLGIEMVKADTYVRGVDTPWKNGSGTLLPKNGPYHYDTKTSSSSGGANQDYQVSEFYLTSSEQVDITSIKGGTVEIPFYISATIIKSDANQVMVCPSWIYSNGTYSCSGFSTATSGIITTEPHINVWTMLVYNNGYTDMCTIDLANNKIRCPIAQMTGNDKIWFIQVRTQVYYSDNFPGQYYYVGLGDKVNLFKNDFVSLEENQNQNHNETISTITDTNTTSDVSSATDFFSDTNITSESALEDIVSAPLTLLNNLATGQYTGICATLNSKQICLPSGDIIWNRSSSGGSHGGSGVHDNYHHWFSGGTSENFISFFNLVFGGYILYRCLLGLFKTIHKMLDPSESNLEVMTF